MALQPYHNILGGVYLVDGDSGNAVSIASENGIFSICQPYLYSISNGAVSNHAGWTKSGFNTATPANTESDIWANGGKYVWASTAGVKMSVYSTNASDTSTGQGIQQAFVKYLTTAYIETSEVITMAGSTSVNLGNTAIRVNNFRAYAVGSSGAALGVVAIAQSGTTTQFSAIPPNYTRARNICYTIPYGKVLRVTSIAFSAASGAKLATVRFTTRATYDDASGRYLGPDFFVPFSEVMLQDAAYTKELELPTKLPAKTDIKITVLADQAGAQVSCALRGWLENA